MKAAVINRILLSLIVSGSLIFPATTFSGTVNNSADILIVGKPLPDAKLTTYGEADVELKNLKGKVKIISVVPQLNTPVCDKQTHRFSETNNGLDKYVDIITVSTNSADGQYEFSEKSNIHNLTFLSDKPSFEFGRKTGLLIEGMNVLRRTIIIADKDNIIRYVDFVPGGGLPNIDKALKAASEILGSPKSKS